MTTRNAVFCALLLLPAANFSCSNPISRFTKQYKCQVTGQSDPQTAYQYVDRGMEHIRLNEFDCAYDACSEAIRLDSRLATAYACRGGVLNNQGDYFKALKEFEQAIKLEPNNGNFYYSRAQVNARLENDEVALADLAKAIDLISSELGRSIAFAERAKIYQKQGKLDATIRDYSEAIRLAPQFAYHFGNRGDVYLETQEYQKAIADYSEAIKLEPTNSYFHRNRAKAYRALGQNELAKRDESQ